MSFSSLQRSCEEHLAKISRVGEGAAGGWGAVLKTGDACLLLDSKRSSTMSGSAQAGFCWGPVLLVKGGGQRPLLSLHVRIHINLYATE